VRAAIFKTQRAECGATSWMAMYTLETTQTAMPSHRFINLKTNTTQRINLPRKPTPIGLSREELRKIVVDLIG
jgi:hypothetical protein